MLAVPAIVVAAELLEKVFGRDYVVSPWAIARLMALSVLAPLAGGMTIGAIRPATAVRLARPIEHAQRWILPAATVGLLIAAAPDMWRLVGSWTLFAVIVFVVGMFAVGHLLGGPDRESAAGLAFASSCRLPATALAIASANFPNPDEHGAVALYGLTTAAVGLPTRCGRAAPQSASRSRSRRIAKRLKPVAEQDNRPS